MRGVKTVICPGKLGCLAEVMKVQQPTRLVLLSSAGDAALCVTDSFAELARPGYCLAGGMLSMLQCWSCGQMHGLQRAAVVLKVPNAPRLQPL